MKILALESSAKAASVALCENGVLVSQAYQASGLTHSRTLLPMAEALLRNLDLTLADLDGIAVAKGPGSFTGIRIGVSAVKGLAFTDNKPVYGISTLEAMAFSAAVEGYIICPVMDARCRQVYTAMFEVVDGKLTRVSEDAPLRLEELEKVLEEKHKKVLFLGDGTDVAVKYFSQSGISFSVFPEIYKYQHASGVAFAAQMRYNNGEQPQNGAELLPDYLRLSQAERERKNKGDNIS